MKKTYMRPSTLTVQTELQVMICQSGVNSNNGIGYGGVDEEGTKDPASRKHKSEWDDDEEED